MRLIQPHLESVTFTAWLQDGWIHAQLLERRASRQVHLGIEDAKLLCHIDFCFGPIKIVLSGNITSGGLLVE